MMCKAEIVKWYRGLVAELGEAYHLLYVLLGQLPVPLTVVRRQEDDPVAAIRALSRAWELISLQDVSEDITARLQAMITDWLTGYELAVAVANHGPAVWRVRGLEAAIARFNDGLSYVTAYLEGQPGSAGPGIQVNPEG